MTFEKEKKATPAASCRYGMGENTEDFFHENGFRESEKKPGLLLHSCCGPCSTSVVERLIDEFDITIFFYNPCITEEEEYQRRRLAQIQFIKKFNEENIGKVRIYFVEEDYRPTDFLRLTKGLENEPEGGARCRLCFRQRLEKTAERAKMMGFDYFGTTLTVSPHKDYGIISETGRRLALKYGLSFLDRDFKKKDGFRHSIELSKKYELYRQDYCGCKYSKRVGEE